ncbi:MAG: TPM domain-containing protein [Leptospiraceae bacterium]|nr:TPM domain-containing protein [Leptospiraceae bacterium]
MKFYALTFIAFILANSIYALEVPRLSGRVIDEVGILSNEEKKSLEIKLKEHEKKTSNQVVVLIIPSLEGEVLEEYSIKVASTWKLGQKGKDNGVLLLIAKNDRKLRIEVGYGLEGSLTDVLSSQIIRREITPEFKKGNFPLGVEQGVDAILGAIQGSYTVANTDNSTDTATDTENFLDFANAIGDADLPLPFRMVFGSVFFIVITPFTLMAAFSPYIGWFLYFFLIPFYAIFPLVSLGKYGVLLFPIYVVGMFLFKIYLAFSEDGKKFAEKYGSTWQAQGSGGGGSGWSSGSSGGGGFSGGGGSFGGGGSSGSW